MSAGASASSPAGVDSIFDLFARFGERDYVGEAVSQAAHAAQAAAHAARAGAAPAVVAAALLHDVGHMVGLSDPAAHAFMGDCGAMHHERLGGAFLAAAGLPARVSGLVAAHVSAKRYLTGRDAGYLAKLSPASATTLGFQGGPMTPAECDAFEAEPEFRTILLMRTWDEAAKVPGARVPPVAAYEPLLRALAAGGDGEGSVPRGAAALEGDAAPAVAAA